MLIVSLYFLYFEKSDNNVNIMQNINKDSQVINTNMLTLMYETNAGSGIYEETKDTTWPEEGYIFNDTLSGCENGGELDYNSQNNTVNLLSNSSDRCYVYFDKYDGVWIDNIDVTNITGSSITLNVSATSENGSITTYYYSLNDSEEYIPSTNNVIIIKDLIQLTKYTISVYAEDSVGKRSNIYELEVTTTDATGPVITNVTTTNITMNSISVAVQIESPVEVTRYYYSIDNGNSFYLGGSTHTFSGLTGETDYNILVYVIDTEGKASTEYSLSSTTQGLPTLATVCSNGDNLANCIKELYNAGGEGYGGLYLHDGLGTYENYDQEAGDNSYRYSGANPNNYVCFGSTAATCPDDNLYRIIGVFDNQVKLIKNTSIGNYTWSGLTTIYVHGDANAPTNTWSSSILNTGVLNETYLNGLGSTWSNKIATTTWKVGGTSDYFVPVKTMHNNEIINPSETTTYSSKIGLMYVSDYGYAVTPNYWQINLFSYNSADITQNDWMYLGAGMGQLTISRLDDYDSTDRILTVRSSGAVMGGTVYNFTYFDPETAEPNAQYATRPVFYLNSSITYSRGTGEASNPVRIN